MMRNCFIKCFYVVFLFFVCSGVLWCEKLTLSLQNTLLETELSLAKKRDSYVLIDTSGKRIFLKGKGVLLREWEIKKISIWGIPFSADPSSLIKKTSLFPPKREKIEPKGKSDDEKFELEAMELQDMPVRYNLYFERNIHVYVWVQKKNVLSSFAQMFHSFKWHTLCPIYAVYYSLKKQPFTAINLGLTSRGDGQSLYWALREGIKLLFY